jgi:hypothetical protein
MLQGGGFSLALALPALSGIANGGCGGLFGEGGCGEGVLGVEGGVAGGFGAEGVAVEAFLERHVVVEDGVMLAQTQQLHNGLVLKRGSQHPVLL